MSDTLSFNRAMDFAYGEAKPVAPLVVRLVADNPGPFTFKGTNTYLIGDRSLAVVDPGPDSAAHCAAILRAARGRPITHILLTHTHRDHVDGLPRLKAATGAVACAFAPVRAQRGALASSPSGSEFVDLDFTPDLELAHGETLDLAECAVTALHTPGHAPDHLCFALSGATGAEGMVADGVLLSGDHVMGWNTSVVAPPEGNMAAYLASLELLLARRDTLYLPGHGGRIREPTRTVRAYLVHRRMREQAILDAIRAGATTIRTIVPAVYRGLDPRLSMAAALSVQAHVEHLAARHLVAWSGPLTWDRPVSAV